MKNIERGRGVHFFTGLEHTLVRQFLARDGIHAHEDADLPPGESHEEDWRAYLDVPRSHWDESVLGVQPRRSAWDNEDYAVHNAVARVCLSYVDREDTHWRPRRSNALRAVPLVPQFLLAIEWRDEERRVAALCEYFAIWIPYYECTVVAASTDSPAVYHGYRELALGAFTTEQHPLQGVRGVLSAEWARFEACRARFREFGWVDGPLARAWASRVK